MTSIATVIQTQEVVMKFPKSLHAEGWSQHLDKNKSAAPAVGPTARPAAGRRVLRDEPLHREPPLSARVHASPGVAASGFTAAPTAAPHAAAVRRPNATPWLLGAGVGIVAVGLGIAALSRNTADTTAPPAALVAQADTAAQPSPEDALLNAEPPAAGTATADAGADAAAADGAEPSAAAPVVTPPAATPPAAAEPAPRRESPRAVAAAAQPSYEPPAVVRAAPEPVLRERLPEPQTLAQATPPVVTPPEPQSTTPAPVVTPPEQVALTPTVVPPVETPATPVQPPVVAQAEPQPQPATANPEDAGITQQVRVALASDATLVGLPIVVSTQQGVVKLEGQAPDTPTRERATVVASSTSGVKAVDNRLTVVAPTVVSQAPSLQ
jgi:hypothetical protein